MGAGTDPLRGRDAMPGSAGADNERQRIRADTVSDDPEVIAAEIERTRGEMTATVDAIQHRLDPEYVAEQAVGAATEATTQAKDAAIEVTEQARDAAKDVAKYAIDEAKTAVRELTDQATKSVRASTVGRVEHMTAEARETAQDVGIDMIGLIRQNPIPAALAAVGIGWLWMERSKTSDGYDRQQQGYPYGGYRDSNAGSSGDGMMAQAEQSAGQMAGQAQQVAGQVMGQAQQAADQVQHRAQSAMQGMSADPIAIGALGLAMGAVAALLLPETEQERQLMGDARDRLVSQAQEKGAEALDKAQQVAKEAGKTVMEEAKAQGMGQEGRASASPA